MERMESETLVVHLTRREAETLANPPSGPHNGRAAWKYYASAKDAVKAALTATGEADDGAR